MPRPLVWAFFIIKKDCYEVIKDVNYRLSDLITYGIKLEKCNTCKSGNEGDNRYEMS